MVDKNVLIFWNFLEFGAYFVRFVAEFPENLPIGGIFFTEGEGISALRAGIGGIFSSKKG